MRCVLHIGVEKTGTTSIQHFLTENRGVLLESGCLVPVLSARGGHSALCVACSEGFLDDDLCRYSGVSSPSGWKEFRGRLSGMLKEEIRGSGEVSTLVFSSEHIQSRLRSAAAVERLKSLLTDAGATSFHVLVYLRDPEDIAASLYSTSVKYGNKAAGAPPPTNAYYRNVCHHRETLERFGFVFGAEAVVPRLFIPEEFEGGSVVTDFCKAAALDAALCASPTHRRNPALSRTGIELLRRLNETVPVFVDWNPNPAGQHLMKIMETHFHEPAYRLSDALRLAYRHEFAASNEWVRQRYFPDRPCLFPPNLRNETGHTPELPSVEWDRISELIRELIGGAD